MQWNVTFKGNELEENDFQRHWTHFISFRIFVWRFLSLWLSLSFYITTLLCMNVQNCNRGRSACDISTVQAFDNFDRHADVLFILNTNRLWVEKYSFWISCIVIIKVCLIWDWFHHVIYIIGIGVWAGDHFRQRWRSRILASNISDISTISNKQVTLQTILSSLYSVQNCDLKFNFFSCYFCLSLDLRWIRDHLQLKQCFPDIFAKVFKAHNLHCVFRKSSIDCIVSVANHI